MTDKQQFPLHIKAFFITVLAVFVLVPITNLYIDPTGIFFSRKRIINPDASANWIPMRHILDGKEECNSFIFGTSRALIWDTTTLPNKPCKLIYPGKGLQSFLRGIKTLIENNIKINTIYITVERAAFYNQERFDYKKSARLSLDYPGNYDEIFFAYKTLLYANTFSNIKKFLKKPEHNQFPVWIHDLYASDITRFRHLTYRWEPHLEHIKWKNEQERIEAINGLAPYLGVEEYRDYEPEIVEKIITEIKALSHKYNFKVVFIRAPIFVKNIVATNKYEFFDAYRRLANLTPFYDFSYDIEYSRNPAIWIDSSHYNKNTAKLITDNLEKNSNEMTFGAYITKDNIDAHISRFEKNVYNNFIGQPHPPNTKIDDSWLLNQ